MNLVAKLAIALTVLLIIPYGLMSFLAYRLADQTLGVGINERVEHSFSEAIDISRHYYLGTRRVYRSTLQDLSVLRGRSWNDQRVQDFIRFRVGVLPAAVLRLIRLTDMSVVAQHPEHAELPPPVNYDWKNEERVSDLMQRQVEGVNYLTGLIWWDQNHSVELWLDQGNYQPSRLEPILQTYETYRRFFENRDALVIASLRVFLVIGGIGIVLAAIGAVLVAMRLRKPLIDLEQALQQLAQGDQDIHLVSQSDDEAGRLAVAFNRMISRIGDQQKRKEIFAEISLWKKIGQSFIDVLEKAKIQQPVEMPFSADLPLPRSGATSLHRLVHQLAREMRGRQQEVNFNMDLCPGDPHVAIDQSCLHYLMKMICRDLILERQSTSESILFVNTRLQLTWLEVRMANKPIPGHSAHEPGAFVEITDEREGVTVAMALVQKYLQYFGGRMYLISERSDSQELMFTLPLARKNSQ